MIKNNYTTTKLYRKPKYSWLKSGAIEHLKTSHQLSKTIKQDKKFSQVIDAGKNSTSSLYSERTKPEFF